MEKVFSFPKGFLWGSATSSYQVEGGINNSDWSVFFDAKKCCDHYNLYKEDIQILKKLFQNAYRFSLEWSRIEPEEGVFDQKEIDHYREMLVFLKKLGIKSMVTLHHFSLPLWFSKKGGFENGKSAQYFLRFAKEAFENYKDLVDFWITINEPLVYAGLSRFAGRWPPQKKNFFLFFKVLKNLIKAHKAVYQHFHKSEGKVFVGIAKNNVALEPANPKSVLDRIACRGIKFFWNEKFLKKVKGDLDFIGLNFYFYRKISFPFHDKTQRENVADNGWPITPRGIYLAINDLRKHNLPLFITENGLSDGKDKKRKKFIAENLFWINKAINEGADVRGYFHWSLMDNFEWDKGFLQKFGLLKVNFKTLERKVRKSALFFAKICRDNYLVLENLGN